MQYICIYTQKAPKQRMEWNGMEWNPVVRVKRDIILLIWTTWNVKRKDESKSRKHRPEQSVQSKGHVLIFCWRSPWGWTELSSRCFRCSDPEPSWACTGKAKGDTAPSELPTQELCHSCHGPSERHITPDVRGKYTPYWVIVVCILKYICLNWNSDDPCFFLILIGCV